MVASLIPACQSCPMANRLGVATLGVAVLAHITSPLTMIAVLVGVGALVVVSAYGGDNRVRE